MPRRKVLFKFLGYALWPILPRSKAKQGRSPGINWLLPAGHSRRRTSDGKAEAARTTDSLGSRSRSLKILQLESSHREYGESVQSQRAQTLRHLAAIPTSQ